MKYVSHKFTHALLIAGLGLGKKAIKKYNDHERKWLLKGSKGKGNKRQTHNDTYNEQHATTIVLEGNHFLILFQLGPQDVLSNCKCTLRCTVIAIVHGYHTSAALRNA